MRQRVFTASLILALALIATPALAQTGFYLGAFAGTQYLEDSALRSTQGDRRLIVEFDWGGHAGLALGYNTGHYFSKYDNITGRIELEVAARQNDVDMVEQGAGFRSAGGEMKVTSLMANTWIDIQTDSIFVPFFGGGLGAARLVFDNPSFSDDSDTRFAYQVGGGVGLPVGRHLSLDLGYRYFATLDATFTDVAGVRNEMDYATHNLTFGLRLNF
ncbi:Opacity protein [Geoalkalibacter ferrihydriticus]|uniref:Opacity protein n=1 Tax=Geoalkalibacter ferrihydriticus TaxID=392333 RepID=A0A1G9N815_9BACT|nr:outer membrane beta-barrel protein [Geoalkalibacter ferrihydriticus]SDL82600.1 Opacity protein [Geoalkalibacter ferrihydriticus]